MNAATLVGKVVIAVFAIPSFTVPDPRKQTLIANRAPDSLAVLSLGLFGIRPKSFDTPSGAPNGLPLFLW